MFYSLVVLATTAHLCAAQTDYTQHVLPFLGTEGGGNMFPGVTRPLGMAKLGPDVADGSADAYSGYLPSGSVSGFSMMHESGTGGAPKYGVVSQFPVVGGVPDTPTNVSSTRSTHDTAQVGYYKSSLSSGVTVELAGSDHAGLYRYTFGGQGGSVVVDVSHVLPSNRGQGLSQGYSGGNITVFGDGHYEGSGTYNNGWNRAPDWTIHFCGFFDAKATSRVFGSGGSSSSKSAAGSGPLGAVFTFGQNNVSSRVGISWLSSEKACQYANSEIPSSASFDSVVASTRSAWNRNVFSKVTTTDTNTTNLQLLYTSLYGMHLIPTNRTGENPKWTSSEPYYDDIVTYWDLFRCHTPLFHILQPVAYEEQIRSLIDIWRHDGWLPDARSSNFNGRTQGGSNVDNVLADAYVKGVRGSVDWGDGYQALRKDGETVPPPNNDPEAPDSSTAQGRGALSDWRKLGYITPKFTRAVSRAVEYAVNDFSLYQVAKGQGQTSDANKYLTASRNWRNHWNKEVSSLGSRGFLVPRNADGSFVQQDPLDCGGCYWGDAYYQANSWEYSLTPLHDVATLVTNSGGTQGFIQRLTTLFTPGKNPTGDSRFGKTIFNPGNEPDFASPYLFNFVNRQDLSVATSRQIAQSYYNTGNSGLPGNSDSGAMQAWLLWSIIGLYPLTGQTTFLIGSPWLANLELDLGGGKSLRVTSSGGSEGAHYVQSLKVNGQSWDKGWLTWSDVFANGGTLEFELGSQARNWTTGELPPSPATQS